MKQKHCWKLDMKFVGHCEETLSVLKIGLIDEVLSHVNLSTCISHNLLVLRPKVIDLTCWLDMHDCLNCCILVFCSLSVNITQFHFSFIIHFHIYLHFLFWINLSVWLALIEQSFEPSWITCLSLVSNNYLTFWPINKRIIQTIEFYHTIDL